MNASAATPRRGFPVERWSSEKPLFALTLVLALGLWLLLAISVVGLAYLLLIGAFVFVSRSVFVARVRGSAVKVGPDQLPEIHRAVTRLADRFGLDEPPDCYVMQSGGDLNALASRFLRSDFLLLYSDLLEACGDDTAARDMIIAHELGHLRAGHLRWQWLLLPALALPFPGSALSRAREYTCDRFGLAGAGDRAGALRGLAILAAGPEYAKRVDLREMVRQDEDLDTGWMTLGRWLSTHPPLARRIAALDSSLGSPGGSLAGPARALALVVVPFVLVAAGGTWAMVHLARELDDVGQGPAAAAEATAVDAAAGVEQAQRDFQRLADFIRQEWRGQGTVPGSIMEVTRRWRQERPDEEMPLDPFDGLQYGYEASGSGSTFILWSVGPDGLAGSEDDLIHEATLEAAR